MKISNEFTVSVPVERAWEVLTDLAGIAPCMPGAQLTGVEGETYSGKLRLKVGPVVSEFAGTASFVEKDDAAHRAVINAKGRDARGAGNASASVTASLRPDGQNTVVSVDTDLRISGKLAQFGNRMIGQVSEKLLAQFVDCLESKFAADSTPADSTAADSTAVDSTPADSTLADSSPAAPADPGASDGGGRSLSEAAADSSLTDAPAGPSRGAGRARAGEDEEVSADGSGEAALSRPALRAVQPEAEPVDLVRLAGGTVAKRVVPAAVAVLVVVAVVWYLVAR